MEAIDIDKLKAEGWSHLANFVKLEDGHWGLTRTVAIDCVSTMDVVPVVHGRWEKFTLGTYDFALRLRCSMCQKVVYEEEFRFCPYCGARMDDG